MIASSENPASATTDEKAFEIFTHQRRKDLERIARKTCGEHERDDVAHEAWLMADEVARKTGVPRNFVDPAFQSLLFAHVFQKLVRYTELNVRHADRLDHAPRHAEDAEGAHLLMDRLTGNDGRDPLADLLDDEAASDDTCPSDGILIGTNAGAWVILLRQCDNRMHAVAGRLLVSLSYAYHCMAKARRRATFQHAIALNSRDTVVPRLGAWRRERYIRVPRQLTLDFEPELGLLLSPADACEETEPSSRGGVCDPGGSEGMNETPAMCGR